MVVKDENRELSVEESDKGCEFFACDYSDDEYHVFVNMDDDTALAFAKAILKIVGRRKGFEIIEPSTITLP